MANAFIGLLALALLKAIRLIDPDVISNFVGGLLRRIGPWLPEHRIGRDNLKAAFPEKSDAEIEEILRGVWENLGRVGAEFAHIDRLWDYGETGSRPGRIMDLTEPFATALRALSSGKPTLCFSAHLANWELPAVACRKYGLDTTLIYRRPNLPFLSDAVIKVRENCMGTLVPTGLSAPVQLAAALERGSNVGMLVDQFFDRGVPVTFFGRPARANPLIAHLARHVDCAIYGLRVIRHDGNRFRITLTGPIEPARDAEGKIDVQSTMQAITGVVEGWVREHPEQWLWLHRRWRNY